MQVGIVGLGLIGGSLGLALKKTGMFKEIFGFDNNELHIQQALALGLIDERGQWDEILACDVIFLCTPVSAIVEIIKTLDSKQIRPHTTIIDTGSTKVEIAECIPSEIRKNFVCAHPMSGTENSGPKAAFLGLFANHIVILTDLEKSGELQTALAKEIFIALDMKIVKMDSKSHDNHAAYISHLPHYLSFALANSVLAQQNPKDILALAGGGFKGMIRIAKSSSAMWCDIAKQNKEQLLESLRCFEGEMKFAYKLIEQDRWDELSKWIDKANNLHKIF